MQTVNQIICIFIGKLVPGIMLLLPKEQLDTFLNNPA